MGNEGLHISRGDTSGNYVVSFKKTMESIIGCCNFLAMGKSTDYKRRVVVGINFILVLFGVIITAYGASAQTTATKTQDVALLAQLDLNLIGSLVTFAGIATLVVALAGFVGAYCKVRKALLFYITSFWVISIALIAFGDYLNGKTAQDIYPSWQQSTAIANANRLQFMETFDCCGFDRNTDSYQLQDCFLDLNQYPNTMPCSAAMNAYLVTDVYPVAIAAIVLGSFELIAIVATMAIIFTQKDMQDEFYENPFHG